MNISKLPSQLGLIATLALMFSCGCPHEDGLQRELAKRAALTTTAPAPSQHATHVALVVPFATLNDTLSQPATLSSLPSFATSLSVPNPLPGGPIDLAVVARIKGLALSPSSRCKPCVRFELVYQLEITSNLPAWARQGLGLPKSLSSTATLASVAPLVAKVEDTGESVLSIDLPDAAELVLDTALSELPKPLRASLSRALDSVANTLLTDTLGELDLLTLPAIQLGDSPLQGAIGAIEVDPELEQLAFGLMFNLEVEALSLEVEALSLEVEALSLEVEALSLEVEALSLDTAPTSLLASTARRKVKDGELRWVFAAALPQAVVQVLLGEGTIPSRYDDQGHAQTDGDYAFTLTRLQLEHSRAALDLKLWRLASPCFVADLKGDADVVQNDQGKFEFHLTKLELVDTDRFVHLIEVALWRQAELLGAIAQVSQAVLNQRSINVGQVKLLWTPSRYTFAPSALSIDGVLTLSAAP